MGGGAGTRLFPLTKDRAKPAVPLGGKYRLVDIPISNCLNSGLRSWRRSKRRKVRSGIRERPTLCVKTCGISSKARSIIS